MMKHFIPVLLLFLCGLAGCRGNSPIRCGGSAHYICPPGWFCAMGDKCGGIDKEGTCELVPEECPQEVEPVCGCDGNTYDNVCWAYLKLVSVEHSGACGK